VLVSVLQSSALFCLPDALENQAQLFKMQRVLPGLQQNTLKLVMFLHYVSHFISLEWKGLLILFVYLF